MSAEDLLQIHRPTWHGNPDSRETLVLVHGFGTDQSSWDHLLPGLIRRWRVLTFDNAGVVRTEAAPFAQHKYLSLKSYAQDLLALMDTLDLRGATVMGHSMGAMVALLASLEEPDRFSRLVLLAASPRYLNDVDYLGGFCQEDLKSVYSRVIDNFSGWVSEFAPWAVNCPQQPELAAYFAQTLSKVPPEHVLTVLYSVLQSDHREALRRVNLPCLILQSDRDFFVPQEVARFMHRQIANSRLVNIAASGHFPQWSAPEQVLAALEGWA